MASDILKAADKFKRALLKENDAALKDMSRVYMRAWNALKKNLDNVIAKIAEAKANGDPISPAWLFQQQRYIELMYQSEQEILKFTRYAAAMVGRQQERALNLGEQHSKQLVLQSLGPIPEDARRVGFQVTWNRVPKAAVQNLVGFLRDGSPLSYKFRDMPAQVSQGIRDTMTIGLATGQNPRRIARMVKQAYGDALVNSLNTCRTETLRAYRTASHESYRANSDIVKGWLWSAGHSTRTCAACWAKDGSYHNLDEELYDHNCGRCVAIPVTKSWSELVPGAKVKETSAQPWDPEEHFRKLSDKEQLQVLGPARLKLWKAGKIKLTDLAQRRVSAVWGDSYQPKSIKQLLAEGKITAKEAVWSRKTDTSKVPFMPLPNGLRKSLEGLNPVEQKQTVYNYIESRRSRRAVTKKKHGMPKSEKMYAVNWEGLRFYFTQQGIADKANSPIVEHVLGLAKAPKMPSELKRHTKAIYISTQRNMHDAYWAKTYGIPGFESAATGGTGEIVVYSNRVLGVGETAHEMGHNLARARYSNTKPRLSSDFVRAVNSGELPPSWYAKASIAEDFSESVRLYVLGELETNAPRRYSVIDKLLKDKTYAG